MSAPCCRDCGGTDWNEDGRCRDCRAFPTLGYQVADLIEAACAIPDGDRVGQPYLLTDEQLRFLLWHYRLNPATRRQDGRWRLPFTFFRGSQLTRPQKWGKSPFCASVICAECHPDGPVLFDGWDADGQPVGRPWSTPHVQVTGVSEDQTDNVWRALVPMIELGALRADIPDTGKTRINLPSGGLIEPVTASAVSRLGQRVTFLAQDQTESWLQRNGGRALADNQRRGLGAMGGRFMETPNAWDPTEESVAQQTSEGQEPGVYLDDVDPGAGSLRNKVDRRRMLRRVYGDAATGPSRESQGQWVPWIDIDRIEAEVLALLDRDPGQAARWFFNIKRPAEDAAFAPERVEAAARPGVHPPDGRDELIVVGIDGARGGDSLALLATHVESGHQWPLGIWERPEHAPDDYEHPLHEVDAALSEAWERWSVWRVYIDPQYIEHLVGQWQNRWGDTRVLEWRTDRPRQIAHAVRRYAQALATGDVTHDGDNVFVRHLLNARRRKMNVYDDQRRPMWSLSKDRHDSPRKIDAAMAAVLAWEARSDAVKKGATPDRPQRRRAAFSMQR